MDHAAVRRLRLGGREQPPLSFPAGIGADRPVGGVRSADADGPRLGSRAGARRGRARRRRHLQHRRHAGAARWLAARPRVDVDDHQRHGGDAALSLHRGRRSARASAPRAPGDDPERHPQGIYGARYVYLSAGAVDAPGRRLLRVLPRRGAALEHDQRQRLSHPRGRQRCGARGRVHAGRRHRLRRGGAGARAGGRRLRAAHLLLFQCPRQPAGRGRQVSRRAPAVGAHHARALRRAATRSR